MGISRNSIYYLKNRERLNLKRAAYKKAHPEKVKAWAKKYYKTHPGIHAAINRKNRLDPEKMKKIRESNRLCKLRKRWGDWWIVAELALKIIKESEKRIS